jgi:hypothetical protein
MAFNLAGIIEGIGRGGNERFDSLQAQSDYEKKLAAQERLTIAAEGRAKVTANAARRDAKRKAVDERAEQLSLYYSKDQVADIMGGGKARVEYAIKYAENLPSGEIASNNYKMASNIEGLPALGEGGVKKPSSMEDPFSSRFKPSTAAIRKYEGLYGNMLSQNTTFMMEAQKLNDPDKIAAIESERTNIMAGLKEYEDGKRKVDDVPSTDIYAGSDVESKNLDTVVKGTKSSALMNSDAVEIDRVTKKYIRYAGSTGIGHSAQIAALNILKQTEGKYSERLTSRVDLEIANLARGLRADGTAIMESDRNSTTTKIIKNINPDDWFSKSESGTLKAGTLWNVNGIVHYYVGSPVEALEGDNQLQNFLVLGNY